MDDVKEKQSMFCGKTLSVNSFLNKSCFGERFMGILVSDEPKQPCVIKRIEKRKCDDDWGVMIRQRCVLNHFNVQQILAFEKDDIYRYFGLEQYRATLHGYCNFQFHEPMPSPANVFCDIARGIKFIHDRGLRHGNISPRNILIFEHPHVHIKVSDFGLNSTTVSAEGANDIDHIKYWMPPSSIVREDFNINKKKIMTFLKSVEADVYAVGCIFFYYITRGIHPFGENTLLTSMLNNISSRTPINIIQLNRFPDHFIKDEIREMIIPTTKTEPITNAYQLERVIQYYEANRLRRGIM